MQELFKFQGQYGLSLIAETVVPILVEKFDPGKSKVTLKSYAAQDEKVKWVPREYDDPDWNPKEKHFKKVFTTNIFLSSPIDCILNDSNPKIRSCITCEISTMSVI